MSWLAALISGGASLAANWMNNRAQKSALQDQNQFNLDQYEDWKQYNSLSEQVKRARQAGISPFSLNPSNTVSQPYSQQNAVENHSMLEELASALPKSLDSYFRGEDRKLRKLEAENNVKLRREALELQRLQLQSLSSYRSGLLNNASNRLDFQRERASESDRRFAKSFGLSVDSYLMRRDAQKIINDYNIERLSYMKRSNPYLLQDLKSRASNASKLASRYDEYLNAQLLGMSSRSQLLQNQLHLSNFLYQKDLAVRSALLDAQLEDITNSPKSAGWYKNIDAGLNLLDKAIGIGADVVNIRRGIFGGNAARNNARISDYRWNNYYGSQLPEIGF